MEKNKNKSLRKDDGEKKGSKPTSDIKKINTISSVIWKRTRINL